MKDYALKLKIIRIVNIIADIDPNGVDGRCHFCKARTKDAIEHHDTQCPWCYANRYIYGQDRVRKYDTIRC